MINRAEQSLEGKLVRDIEQLKRENRDIKNVQLIGSDNTLVEGTNLAQVVSVIPAGSSTYFEIIVTPLDGILTLWDLFFTVYIDGSGFSDQQIFPTGSNLTLAQTKHRIYHWGDWANSSDALGRRNYRLIVENFDVSQHTVGVQAKLYSIKNPSTV